MLLPIIRISKSIVCQDRLGTTIRVRLNKQRVVSRRPPHTCYNSIESCPAPDPTICNQTQCALGIGPAAGPGHCSCAGGAPFVRGGGGAGLPFLLSTTGSLMNIPLRRGNFTR